MKQLTLSLFFAVSICASLAQEVDPTKQLQLNVQTVPAFMTNYKLDTMDVMNVPDSVVYLRGFGKAYKLRTGLLKYQNFVRQYNKKGLVTSPTIIFSDTITVSTGNGQLIDLSGYGFTKITSIQVNGALNTNTATDMPIVELRNWTNSAAYVNVMKPSNVALNLSIVTAGLAVPGIIFYSAPVNVFIHVSAFGY